MKPEKIELSAECNLQQIEELVSNFERIAKNTETKGILASRDILPITNFLLLLKDPGCVGIEFSRDQARRIHKAYSLLNAYYPVPENPEASFEVLKKVEESRKYVEQLLSRSEARD